MVAVLVLCAISCTAFPWQLPLGHVAPDEHEFVRMEVTAYCPCKICCGKWADGMTASGKPAKGALAAADPFFYAFGTYMRIEGYNGGEPFKVWDTGGKEIKGRWRIDLLFPTHEQAKQYGRRRNVMVEVLRMR